MILKKPRFRVGSRASEGVNGDGHLGELLQVRPAPSPEAALADGSFEAFAQHAFDAVFGALQQANEKIERLTVERDEALARVRALEAHISKGERLQPSLIGAQRPWQALLSHTPQEPAGRSRWTVALALLILLPLAGIEIARSWLNAAAGHGWGVAPVPEIVTLIVLGLVALLLLAALIARRTR